MTMATMVPGDSGGGGTSTMPSLFRWSLVGIFFRRVEAEFIFHCEINQVVGWILCIFVVNGCILDGKVKGGHYPHCDVFIGRARLLYLDFLRLIRFGEGWFRADFGSQWNRGYYGKQNYGGYGYGASQSQDSMYAAGAAYGAPSNSYGNHQQPVS
ncbi:hypothetical protein FXO38_23388 [Capsicum annuum]|nr:hypothetical protein FXO38_23388 [Capsicum annuum]